MPLFCFSTNCAFSGYMFRKCNGNYYWKPTLGHDLLVYLKHIFLGEGEQQNLIIMKCKCQACLVLLSFYQHVKIDKFLSMLLIFNLLIVVVKTKHSIRMVTNMQLSVLFMVCIICEFSITHATSDAFSSISINIQWALKMAEIISNLYFT